MGLYRKTPLMGWASWNCYRTDISEEKIKAAAKALKDTGLADCGYEYVNIDDGFFGGRAEDGTLKVNTRRFPNGMAPVAEYIHSLGLKAGIYAEGGDNTCGFYYDNEGTNGDGVGLYGHEEQDLKMYLIDWDYDFIKVDWCGGVRLGLDEEEQYTKIGDIIDRLRHEYGKCLVYNICRWQFPGVWATEIADSWRTGADIEPVFSSVIHQLDNIKPLHQFCRPTHVNDLDMMQIGNGMPFEDEKTHFIMWCMMSTPLMIGCDPKSLSGRTLELLKNRELIAINQDAACVQAFPVWERKNGDTIAAEVWVKPLAEENERAVALLNRSEEEQEISFALSDAGLFGINKIRDIYAGEDVEVCDTIAVTLKPHEARVFKISADRTENIEISGADTDGFNTDKVKKLTRDEANKIIAEGGIEVDVRTREEFEDVHTPGAMNLPYTDIHATAKSHLTDKNRPIVLFCGGGKRSLIAANSLYYLGYKKLFYTDEM